MKTDKNKDILIERLKKTPIVQIACEKAGISRATYYRWRQEDQEFTKSTDAAIDEGNDLVNDMAESQLMSAIRDKNMTAISFWLKHHHKAYTTKVEITTNKNQEIILTDEQKELLNKAIEMAALIPAKEEINE